MPPQRHTPHSKVRQRSSRACEPCRKRKVKCNGELPCDICEGYGYDCSYHSGAERPERTQRSRTSGSEVSSEEKIKGSGDAIHVQPSTHGTSEKDVNPAFVATEIMMSSSDVNPYLLLPWKMRFTIAHSAIAMPRSLGIALGVEKPPRLQSFGWNAGLRAEPQILPQNNLCNIITFKDMKALADVYFAVVHPFFGVLVPERFARGIEEYWAGTKQSSDYEACFCGVVALGSYFSKTGPSPVEAQIVEQGRLLLDLSTSHAPALLSLKHVIAWVLRALYLRLTTRPHLSWMASCTAVHLAEAVGLHREIYDSQLCRESAREYTKCDLAYRRRIFWVAVSLNQFMSSEYGRTRVPIDLISCETLDPVAGDLTAEVVTILQSTPAHQKAGSAPEMLDALRKATALPTKSAFLGLLKADACFCIYRMLRISNVTLPGTLTAALLGVIKVGLDGVKFIASMREPWWNIVGVPFHSVCILLALGTPESLAMIPAALETLKNVVTQYDSHFSREALGTAYSLTKVVRERRIRELEALDQGLLLVGEQPAAAETTPEEILNHWLVDDDMGFSDFFNSQGYDLAVLEGGEWPSLV